MYVFVCIVCCYYFISILSVAVTAFAAWQMRTWPSSEDGKAPFLQKLGVSWDILVEVRKVRQPPTVCSSLNPLLSLSLQSCLLILNRAKNYVFWRWGESCRDTCGWLLW